MMRQTGMGVAAGLSGMAAGMVAGVGVCAAQPQFFGTGSPQGNWFVSTHVSQTGEGLLSSFRTDNFVQAVNVNYDPNRTDWIADVPSGSHGGVGNWTFFVFRQTFDLTGYDPTTANLVFRWAADDSGEIFAMRGSWIPAFSLNGGAFVNYPNATPQNRIPTYTYSEWTSLSSGFVEGLNTIDFYVQGNGQTDGFGLQVQSFTAEVPSPGATALAVIAAGVTMRRRRRAVSGD